MLLFHSFFDAAIIRRKSFSEELRMTLSMNRSIRHLSDDKSSKFAAASLSGKKHMGPMASPLARTALSSLESNESCCVNKKR